MPWTIYRYILLDVIRLLLLATMALVMVIALAVTVQELQEGLLGPIGLIKFIAYTMPTTIGFALPFAAAFASTLVFTRLVADNEITACRASGISYRSLLLPVLFLGLILTLGLFHLSNWVIPTFYKAAQRMVEQDVIQLLVNQLKRGQPFKRQNMVLYADAVHDAPIPPELASLPDIKPQRLIVLQGVAVAQLDDDGKLKSDTTAERADVLVYRARRQTWVKVYLDHTQYFDAAAQSNGAFSKSLTLQEIPLPNPLRNREEFLSLPELRELAKQPEQYEAVAKPRHELVSAMAREQIVAAIVKAMDEATPVRLAGSANEFYLIHPTALERNNSNLRLGSEQRPVRIDYFADGQAMHHYHAAGATLMVDPQGQEPHVRIELSQARVQDARLSDRQTQRQLLRLPWMRWPQPVRQHIEEQSTRDLLTQVQQQHSDDAAIMKPAESMSRAIKRLGLKVMAQQHERAASAVACMFVLLLGALLSLKLQGRMPLVIYFWSFLLATMAVIIIQGGGQVATDRHGSLLVGLITIWAGNGLLLAACAMTYWRLYRT